MKAIEESKKSEYSYLPPIQEKYAFDDLIISIIIDCYYGLDLVKQSVQSVLNQDYRNIGSNPLYIIIIIYKVCKIL